MPRRAGRALRSAFLERRDQATDASERDRRKPEDDATGYRNAQCEQQDHRVDGDVAGSRQAGWIRAHERAHADARE